jgi:hypothetical protein
MTGRTALFLSHILHAEGLRIGCILTGGGMRQHVFETTEQLAQFLLDASARGQDTYHACATYRERKGIYNERKKKFEVRCQANVLYVSSLWADIDTREGKPDAPYADRYEAAAAALAFCGATGMPPPLFVGSGYGVHVYWPLRDAIPEAIWREYSNLLAQLFEKHGLKVDKSRTQDSASILRPPGTHNHKNGGRALVECGDLVGPYRLADLPLSEDAINAGSAPSRPSIISRITDGQHSPPPWSATEEARLGSALACIPADDRDTWLRIGMALHWLGWGERAFQIWCEWSRTAPQKYNEGDQRKTWTSFDRRPVGPRITDATIFHMAKERGWADGTNTHAPAKAPVLGGATDDSAEITRLAQSPRLVYERERKGAAKRLGCRESILDKLVEAARGETSEEAGQGAALDLLEHDPWPDPVDGSALLHEVASAIVRYVVLSGESAVAIALWVVHAHAFKSSLITPRLVITSPEKRCGKTRLLQVIWPLVPKPLLAANITAPAMFRTVAAERPTLLIDEADTFLGENLELRGVLNSGHERNGTFVRTVGEDHEPRRFSTWCPTVIAAIGKLPGTIEDRAIRIVMRRRRRDESVERFRSDRCDDLLRLGRMARRWVDDQMDALCEADPAMPNELNDRAADNWRPLLTIADLAGGNWPKWARAAALAVSADGSVDQDSMRTALLNDIRAYFRSKGSDRASSDDLVNYLVALDDRPWSEMNRGKPMTKATLARLLKPFEIFPDTIRLDATRTAKGYHCSAFEDAFARYLSTTAVTT